MTMAPNEAIVRAETQADLNTQLDTAQSHKASKALLNHLKVSKQDGAPSKTKNLLEPDSVLSNEPIWLIATTKKHIVPQKRLKPSKVLLPHSLHITQTLSICLITPDPQRAFKDVVSHSSFPKDLFARISRVIDVKKLKKKYHSFESKRQLMDSHDLFLADDRIITYLPKLLGKTFYTSTSKRPIPVCLQPSKTKEKKNAALPSLKPKKNEPDPRSIITPSKFAHEIERTLQMTMINLTPSATTAVRVGLASFTPEQLVENIEAVTNAVVEKFVQKKWKGMKALHIKGPNSMALPIWLAEELWEDQGQVLEEAEVEQARIAALPKKKRRQMLEGDGQRAGKKRRIEDADSAGDGEKKRRVQDADLSQEMKERREKLRQQKKQIREKLEGDGSKSKILLES